MTRMRKPVSTSTKSQGGYAKDRTKGKGPRSKLHTRDIDTAIPVVIKRKPLPPGLKQALEAKASLFRTISNWEQVPAFTISVDPIDDTWCLVIRGLDTGYEWYEGYLVKHVRSNFIRNPMSKHIG